MPFTTAPSALRAAGGRTWLPSISGGAALRQRWFSISPAHRGGRVITFGETSSDELSQLLNTFREKVILPTYLAGEQRRKIYNPKLKQVLQNDPITMEIDGAVHKFSYIKKVEDLPNTNKTVNLAVGLMKTRADFENLPRLLEGCVRARRKLKHTHFPKMIRRAALHDSLHVIMECVKAVENTGFKLDSSEKINELLINIQLPAIKSGWNEAKTKTALRQAQLILNLLESDENHKPSVGAGRFPFCRDPHFLGVRLHLAAARAVYHQHGKDEDGKVTKYAEELVALWPEGAGILDLQPDQSYQDRLKMRYMLERNSYLYYASPVLHGLTLAAQVVDPGLAMQLQNRADAVESEVKAALAALEGESNRKGPKMYNMLFNPQVNVQETEEAETSGE